MYILQFTESITQVQSILKLKNEKNVEHGFKINKYYLSKPKPKEVMINRVAGNIIIHHKKISAAKYNLKRKIIAPIK